MRVVRTATMTTVDLVSNIGGTLGLFCGMSVLSMVEIVYWVARGVMHSAQGRGKEN